MKSRNGFTLVELLGVVIVMGVIMIVAAPMVLDALNKSKEQIDEFNIKSLYDGVSLYLQDIDEQVTKYVNNTGHDITIAKTGRTYRNGETLKPYDFKCYVIENDGIDIKITDLVKNDYFDPNCSYEIENSKCKIKDTCVITGIIKYEVSDGYYVTTGYDAKIKSGCVDNESGKEFK